MRLPFHTADVFTDRPFGGNPLAVLPDARGLSGEQMQTIAREFNLSETTFVLPPDDPAHTCKVRIFTPAAELPFAGHPTVGTALVLAWTGAVALTGAETDIVLEEGVGPVPVRLFAEDGRAVRAELTAARLPVLGADAPPLPDLAASLSLPEAAVETGGGGPAIADAGIPFLLVPLAGPDALAEARIDHGVWSRTLSGGPAENPFLFCRTGEREVRARMFAPALNIAEDPATGSAVTALAAHLARLSETRDGTEAWTIHQGVEMGRPSRLALSMDFDGGALSAVRVAGGAVPVMSGEIAVPEASTR